jgi:transcriptional regulator with XRE-family HTH domain
VEGSQLKEAVERGKRLKRAREDAGITQEDLAQFIGKDKSIISYYESGNRRPRYETLKKICDRLNVPVEYVLSGDPVKEGPVKYNILQIFTDYDNVEILINDNPLSKEERLRLLQAMINEYLAFQEKK